MIPSNNPVIAVSKYYGTKLPAVTTYGGIKKYEECN